MCVCVYYKALHPPMKVKGKPGKMVFVNMGVILLFRVMSMVSHDQILVTSSV